MNREVIEGEIRQGTSETMSYRLTSTPWGSNPTSVGVAIYDVTSGIFSDVSSTTLTGTASVEGDIITLPAIHGLTLAHRYLVLVTFTVSGNIETAKINIIAER